MLAVVTGVNGPVAAGSMIGGRTPVETLPPESMDDPASEPPEGAPPLPCTDASGDPLPDEFPATPECPARPPPDEPEEPPDDPGNPDEPVTPGEPAAGGGTVEAPPDAATTPPAPAFAAAPPEPKPDPLRGELLSHEAMTSAMLRQDTNLPNSLVIEASTTPVPHP
jgi:hypothetical protein